MYGLSANEIFFYIELVCTKHKLEINSKNIKEITEYIREDIELPITEIEVGLVLSQPHCYDDTRIIIKNI